MWHSGRCAFASPATRLRSEEKYIIRSRTVQIAQPCASPSSQFIAPITSELFYRIPSITSQNKLPHPAMSSRRTSWSLESGGDDDSRIRPLTSPFDHSRAPSRAGSEEEPNTQTVSQKYNILPSIGMLLYPEDVEKDDWLHTPDPNEKEPRDCRMLSRRGMINMGILVFIIVGLLVLFIVYYVL